MNCVRLFPAIFVVAPATRGSLPLYVTCLYSASPPICKRNHYRGRSVRLTTQIFGAPITRQEDQRFLTGKGTYIDDIDLPDMLHAAILRSPLAHATIRSIDTSQAKALDGVEAVLTYKDLSSLAAPLPLLIPHPALTHPHTQRALANDVVRYVGEAVA